MKLKYFFLSLLIAAFALQATAQSAAQREKLLELSAQFKIKSQTEKAEAVRLATEKGWAIRTEALDGRITELMRLDEKGMPMYYTTYNAQGAALINSDKLYPGGAAGLNLSGAGQTLGEWDGGGVLLTHQELVGRVTQKDTPAGLHWHSTHVAGTMIASGVRNDAKGMSYGADLSAYDWNNDVSEMAAEAAGGMNVSQHSYGYVTGWSKEGDDWYWYGDAAISATEDFNWGFYSTQAKDWDNVAHNAPNYVIVKSAGNDRGKGPASGATHYFRNPANGYNWELSTTVRDKDGGALGYDCISHAGTAKNIITVGAVTAASAMSSFSGWGPTDDGRIKPDIVAKGVSVISCNSSAVDEYASSSGTSMSGPMVSGSIGLLLEHQENLHPGVKLLSSTIKGLILHTATDLGNPGPDYSYGWGLMNTEAAAAIMTDQAASPVHIYENTLIDLQSLSMQLKAKGGEPLKATIIWNDVPGTPVAAALNPPDLMLVNDLDMRLTAANGAVSFPYILDPGNPATAATTGDNFRDNVEVIYIASPTDGEIYDLQITHKASLSGGSQDYTLIVTGNEAFDYTYLFNAADNAGNYGGSWIDGSNQGSGFGAWTMTSGTNGGFSGHFVGDPSGAGITGMPNPSFGLYANPGDNGNFANADRPLTGPLSIGSTLSFMWGVNWDSNGGGNKGINLYVGGTSGTQIININMGASAAITINGNAMFNDYGTNAMTLNFEYVSAGQLRVYATGRDGVETYDQTIAVAGAPDAIRFYASGLDSGGERQPYFNNFTITTNFNSTPSNSDAVAVGDLTFDADLVLDNLTIESGNSVTIAPLKKLTVNTNIDNQAGTSAFVLQSDATGTASLLHNNNDVDMTIQRYITGDVVTTNAKYHTVSVPLTQSSNPLSGLFTGAYLYRFDQASQDYVTMGTSTTTSLPVNQGYLIYYPGASTTFEFAGKANNGSFSTDVDYPPFGDNYNLVPNPYPSAIDWNAAGWTKTNMNGSIYIYNTTSSSSGNPVWASYNGVTGANGGTQFIPAGQAFFVQSNAAAPVLAMTNEVRVHNAQPFYKENTEEVETLRLFAHANGYTDESVVTFVDESTTAFDGQYDALKFKNWNEAPNIYSLTADKTALSINSIPYSTETYLMELGFEWNESGEATIEIQGMESFGDWVSIMFEDRLTGIRFELRDQNSYSFQHEAEADPSSRFVLHFMGVTAVDELQSDKSDYHIWSADKQLHISNPAALPALLEVFDLQGRLIYSVNLQADAKWIISGLPEPQLLLIRVNNAETVVNQKVFIR